VSTLSEDDLRLLFLDARTFSAWRDEPVPDATLARLYELVRMGPTTANSQPLRLVFVRTPEGKKRLEPALAPTNVTKTMTAPVTVIVAWDTRFYQHMGRLAPHLPGMADRFAGMPAEPRERAAVVSATLQAGYLLLAARGLGLDCGPMGGFDAAKVDAEFFADGQWRSIFLMNLGHGDPSGVHPRAPRLEPAEACRFE
jgi:3-hydroxypropanoate dehydrogenase